MNNDLEMNLLHFKTKQLKVQSTFFLISLYNYYTIIIGDGKKCIFSK